MGRFVVLRTIGEGGMGVVVAAYDPVLDRQIALKVLRAGETPAGDVRLLQEAQAMARLAHPHVVAVHEAGAADGRVYLAMELIDGGTLRAWLAGPRTWREIRDRFLEAGRGLAAAHDAGLVHRDFKPDNVLIGRDGRARVTDFGLVRQTPSVAEAADGETTAIAGTPRYMAPEQHRGLRADARADQFAFCVALYEALWHADPFAAPDPLARQARVMRGDVDPPPPGNPPAGLAAAVLRGLSADPAQRYPDMRALLDDVAHDPAVARTRRLRLAAVGLAGAGLAAAGMVALSPRQRVTCAAAADELAALWPARRDELEAALALARGADAALPARAADALEAWAAKWRIARIDACRATYELGTQSEAELGARVRCLERRLGAMRAVVDTLASGQGAVRDNPVAAIEALPSVAGCGEAAAPAGAEVALEPARRTPVARAPVGETRAPDPRRFQLGIGVAWDAAGSRAERRAATTASLDQAVAAGATSTGLWLDWSAIEPVQGGRDWSYADHQVAELEKRGLEGFASIGEPPSWAAPPSPARCDVPLRSPPALNAASRARFHDFFRTLAGRYCGRVKYYAFWSEPNGCAWLGCGCDAPPVKREKAYALWLNEWYQAMRDGCSDVVLAVGALDCRWGGDPDRPDARCAAFIDQLYENGAGDSFDAVALRPYGYGGDLERALRDHQVVNWAAIRQVSEALARHGNASRMLWVDEWGFATSNEPLRAKLVSAALLGLRQLERVFAARYVSLTDPPGSPAPVGLASVTGTQLAARDAWFAFRDHALGPGVVWHGLNNPGMEFQGQPPSAQFSTPVPSWGPNGAWAFHHRFPRDGNDVLGRKFGYYSAGTAERFTQILADTFVARRRYCFQSAAQGGHNKGRDEPSRLPYQLGYAGANGELVVLSTRIVTVDARWRETAGVCHDVGASGPELGRPIAVGFGSGQDGGSSDIWFDNLRVTSVPL